MRIAVFDYLVTRSNPSGGCHLKMIEHLYCDHDFTVFAVEFENPFPERIRWVKVPAPTRPLFLLFLAYHILAPLYYWVYCRRRSVRFDLIQVADGNVLFGDVNYMHFCHRTFLRHYWRYCQVYGLRRIAYWLNYQLHAMLEPWTLRRARWVVVPSKGLEQRVGAEYPFGRGKIVRISNAVDLDRMGRPPDFDCTVGRREVGFDLEDVVLVFAALGNFEHKGLPLVLEAMAGLNQSRLKLVVVGGKPDVVRAYKARARRLKLQDRTVFVGTRSDVRPYLWLADAFVFPSLHETFPLVCLEAAAAGLPLIVTPISGVDEFARDGGNALLVEHTVEAVAAGLSRFLALPAERRKVMGKEARQAMAIFALPTFVRRWREFYARSFDGQTPIVPAGAQ